jgi:hypothetical protein
VIAWEGPVRGVVRVDASPLWRQSSYPDAGLGNDMPGTFCRVDEATHDEHSAAQAVEGIERHPPLVHRHSRSHGSSPRRFQA